MTRNWASLWASAAVLALIAVGGPVGAQQQQDPFSGRFGALELPMSPGEAANDAMMLGQSLQGLEPQRPGIEDVYVLSASLWGEPVFESEASQAGDILREHFGAQGRTIILSAGMGNQSRRFPAANPENIMAALGRIGQVIDPNEDLVVVFLTSHGAQDGSAALMERGRLQGSLKPVHLRDALLAAGIRNRVVIVSACFSGAFIPSLADDNTIVMTAAAHDRTSFGCAPENEWTFFGDAYFNNAVRSGAGMLAAFNQAKTQIEQWESQRHLSPPSNPQRYVGAHAAQMLTAAERAAQSGR